MNMKRYVASYENEDGYDWIEVFSVGDGEDPFERAYQECPSGYSLVCIVEDKDK